MVVAAQLKPDGTLPRPRPQDVDRHVGEQIRVRRMMLGLTQQQMAGLIGVTYQQAHKYETGINRITAGRLYGIAQALGVDVSFFYAGYKNTGGAFKPTARQRLLHELTRNFITIADRRQQEAICNMVRALTSADAGGGHGEMGAA